MGSGTEIRVLGGISLDRGGGQVHIGGPQAQRVLAILVANLERGVSADRVIEALWGDSAPRSANATVQAVISRLRALLAPAFRIDLDVPGYTLTPTGGEIDSARFRDLLARSGSCRAREAVPLLEQALALWRGPAFGPLAEIAEIRTEAVRLDELRLVATERWAEARLMTADAPSMVGELEALVADHPLRESYWRLLMVALQRSGRQAEALRRGAELRTMLNEELGLDPSPEIRDLEARILAGSPDLLAQGPPQEGAVERVILHKRLLGATSFVGRDPEMAELVRAVAEQPLVTLTGPGGVGKTRLAMRAALRLSDMFDGHLSFVEFAALRDPEGTARVLANALDIQQRQYRSLESTIEEHLAPLHALVVLDNCEHLTAAIAPLVDRLRSSCPDLRILATSREPLGLGGEYVTVLAPLELPGNDDTLDAIASSTAVDLFLSRARAASPGFVLTPENSGRVIDVCRRLDGLPLALELAAARLRSMGVDALAAHLHQRVEMLGQAQVGADGRRRTLRDLVEWSYDLLSARERETFANLAVFAGGFDLSAAKAICSEHSTGTAIVAQLASLVDKSMVVLVDSQVPRYRLLEPLREFGLDRLHEQGRINHVLDRHLEWFLGLAHDGAIGLDGPDEARWSSELERNYDNLRVAHLTALGLGDTDRSLRLISCLQEFAFRRIRYEVTAWADSARTTLGTRGHAELPTVLAISAFGEFVRGDMAAAVERARDALEARESWPHPELPGNGLPERVLANALFYLARVDEAIAWMDSMLGSARRRGSAPATTHALYMLSVAHTSTGDRVRGAELADMCMMTATAALSPTAHAQAAYAMGLALEGSDAGAALSHLRRASELAAEAGNRWIEAFALTEVHWIQAQRGDHLVALRGYRDVVDTWYRGGDWANQWLSLRRVVGIFIDLGALEAAAVLHGCLVAVGASSALPFEPTDAEHLTRRVGLLRSELDPAVFADAVRRGASMSDREIISFVKTTIALLTPEEAADASS